MITKRDFILRGSCFCEMYRYNICLVPREAFTESIVYIVQCTRGNHTITVMMYNGTVLLSGSSPFHFLLILSHLVEFLSKFCSTLVAFRSFILCFQDGYNKALCNDEL